MTELLAPRESRVAGSAAHPDAATSETDRLRGRLQAVYAVLMPSFTLGLLAWIALTWMTNRFFGGSIFGLVADSVSSIFVGAVTALIYGTGYHLWSRTNTWRHKNG